jgi:hypothetical protein
MKTSSILVTLLFLSSHILAAEEEKDASTTNCNNDKANEFFQVIDSCLSEAGNAFFFAALNGDIHQGTCQKAQAQVIFLMYLKVLDSVSFFLGGKKCSD